MFSLNSYNFLVFAENCCSDDKRVANLFKASINIFPAAGKFLGMTFLEYCIKCEQYAVSFLLTH